MAGTRASWFSPRAATNVLDGFEIGPLEQRFRFVGSKRYRLGWITLRLRRPLRHRWDGNGDEPTYGCIWLQKKTVMTGQSHTIFVKGDTFWKRMASIDETKEASEASALS
jgi:hypothetical protein